MLQIIRAGQSPLVRPAGRRANGLNRPQNQRPQHLQPYSLPLTRAAVQPKVEAMSWMDSSRRLAGRTPTDHPASAKERQP